MSRYRLMEKRWQRAASRTRIQPLFSGDEGADVGIDEGTPVTEAYTAHGSRFTGRINRVTIALK